MPESWTELFSVRLHETGRDGRLSVEGLCNYFQEVASAHAEATGVSIDDLQRQNLTWVLGRLELEIGVLPEWREEVEVSTWPARVRSFFVARDFLLRVGDRIAARATSTWMVIDLEKRRAGRVPEIVKNLAIPDRERALEGGWKKLPRLDEATSERTFAVRKSDLDVNVHVNNVRYVEWALETLDLDFSSKWRPVRVEIDFLAELSYGDEVRAEAEVKVGEAEAEALVSVWNQAAGAEAARLRSSWVRRD